MSLSWFSITVGTAVKFSVMPALTTNYLCHHRQNLCEFVIPVMRCSYRGVLLMCHKSHLKVYKCQFRTRISTIVAVILLQPYSSSCLLSLSAIVIYPCNTSMAHFMRLCKCSDWCVSAFATHFNHPSLRIWTGMFHHSSATFQYLLHFASSPYF